jgi:O-antigen/teichoic acid export membrane protein
VTRQADPLSGVMTHGAWNLLATLVPGMYALVLTSVLLRTLGPAGYAPWALAVAMVGWLTLLDLGLSATTTRESARAMAGDSGAIARVLTVYATYGAIGLVTPFLGGLAALLIPLLLSLNGVAATEAWLVGVVLAIDLAIVIGTAGWAGTLRGWRRFDLLFRAVAFQVSVSIIAVLVLLPAMGIVGAALAQPIGRTAGRIVLAWTLSSIVPWFRLVPPRPTRGGIRRILAFSTPIIAMQLATQIGMGTDVVIVAAVSGPAAVGAYAAGSQLVRNAALLLFPALGVTLPALSAAAFERPGAVANTMLRAVFIAALLGGTVFGGIVTYAGDVTQVWTGGRDPLTVAVMIVYALAYVLISPVHIMVLTLVAKGTHALVGVVGLVEAVANLALSIVLASTFGPIGVALGTLIVVFVDDLFVIPAITARRVGLSIVRLLAVVMAGWFVSALILAGTVLVPIGGPMGLMVRTIVAGFGVMVVLWTLRRRWLDVPIDSEVHVAPDSEASA